VSGLPDGASLRVLRGEATEEEAVAVLLAVDLARRADEGALRPPEPGWRRAARLEAVHRIRLGAFDELRAISR
jgi:hypothetical protein